MNKRNLKQLIAEGEELLGKMREGMTQWGVDELGNEADFPLEYVFPDHSDYDKYSLWVKKAIIYLDANHKDATLSNEFIQASKRVLWRTTFNEMIDILKAFAETNSSLRVVNFDSIVPNIFNRFQKVEQQLTHRYNSRETLRIKDEYDVQNLLHSLLKLHFDDIRAEEWTPSYAGSSKRMDFLLNDDQIVIEVKKTRPGLNDKKVGEELTIDIAHYKSHPKCKKMYCFVYDKDCHISNPRGIEKDLETQSTPEMAVRVFIRPE